MTPYAIGVLALMLLTALACALPGAYLVTSRQSMLVDAMSHAAFPGIVLAALIWPIGSPLLVLGATALALVVVLAAQWAADSGLVPEDAALGLVFPALFSIGVILLSTRFSHLHLHEDAVLVGDPNIVAVIPLTFAGVNLGPSYAWVMGLVVAANVAFLALTHRKLALVVMDPDYAAVLGLPVRRLRSAAMVMTALTLTASFHAAGAVLVIAFVVVPAATAALFATSFPGVIRGSVVIALVVTTAAFFGTYWTNRPTSSWTALLFGLVFVVCTLGVKASRRARARRAGSA
ncbi:metal ABC transporter permease [Actinomyces sp. B33]|uniref:metal ABC transporter permease n=1 Tax=Actinomyces sp. B33 TaxID=2942131 RepID=UPI002340D99C|nr:metal ABC transporter permease [Actinomyces sp. B33]MDC4232774.1 metal ABC transporter permease [Actinomyces sp. B33]